MSKTTPKDLPWTGERYVPQVRGDIALEHLHRYAFASELTEGKRVLDIACGEGYGSEMLSRNAKSVVGVDIDPATVAHAMTKYRSPKMKFIEGACEKIPLPDKSVDLVVSFETLEHIEDQDQFLGEIERVLDSGGILVISTPEKSAYSDKPRHVNPFHKKELYREQFLRLLSQKYGHMIYFEQKVAFGSCLVAPKDQTMGFSSFQLNEGSMASSKRNGLKDAVYLVAVCSKAPLPDLAGSMYEEQILKRQLEGDLNNTNLVDLEIFYSSKKGDFSEKRKITHTIKKDGRIREKIVLPIKDPAKQMPYWRLDPGHQAAKISLLGMKFLDKNGRVLWDLQENREQIVVSGTSVELSLPKVGLELLSTGGDPFILLPPLPPSALPISSIHVDIEISSVGKGIDSLVRMEREKITLLQKALAGKDIEAAQLRTILLEKDPQIRKALDSSKNRPGFWRRLERSIRKRRKKWINRIGFNRDWYLKEYPDVKEVGMDPLYHYLEFGIREGRRKSEWPKKLSILKSVLKELERSIRKRRKKWINRICFDRDWYLNRYPDVAKARIDAFWHYQNHGIKEGRFKNRKEEKKARFVGTGSKQEIDVITDSESRSKSKHKVFIPSNSLQYFGTVQTDIRAIALYLPQFHAIPENDKWWGKGFTEWINVKRGTPHYEGHYQPHVPHQDLGYYDLNDPSVMEKQAAMAKAAGIEGFCFYYYWFNGKRLLNMPTDRLLATGKPDFPFCFCWANENWTRTWDGGDNEILIEQEHTAESDERFIYDLLPAFRDSRYIRVAGKPLLVVYRPGLLPNARRTTDRWREICRKEGMGEIHLAFMLGFEDLEPASIGFDTAIQMPPLRSPLTNLKKEIKTKNSEKFVGEIRDYRGLRKGFDLNQMDASTWPAVCPCWDNTARKMERAHSWIHSSPENYLTWLKEVVGFLRKNRPAGERIVFINSWNEWGEGCHLEPDEKFGYAWLNATRGALSMRKESQSFKRNPLVAQTLRNKVHSLVGTQATEQQNEFLAEHAALVAIFLNQGNSFAASDGGLLGKDKKTVFSIKERADLENLSRSVWRDLEVMPFCFVLLQYNKWDQTLKCVESIKKLVVKNHPIEIIIVDNASSEDVLVKTRELFGNDKNISLIFNPKNLGFSGGNNIGYRYARESFGDAFIVVMNNDVVIHDSEFVAKSFQLFRDWSYSVLGPDIVTPDGRRENPWNDYVYGLDEWDDFHNLYVHQKEGYLKTGRAEFRRIGERNPQNKTSVNPILQGACYIFSPIFTHCHQSPFDESTFLYGEEFPFAIGCLTNGHLMLYSSELAVAHEEGVSTGLLKEQKKMLHGYDGALKGIELASLRLRRQGDATVGHPIGIEACLIRNLTTDGRRHVLIDLFFCQPGFHGAGEYGKAVFAGLTEEQLRRPDIQIWAALDPDLFIDEWVWNEVQRFAINIVQVKSYSDVIELVNMNCFYSFFAPAIVTYTGYEYMKRVGGRLMFDRTTKTKLVGTLHDMRDYEMAANWETIATARKKAGCLPESNFTELQWNSEKAKHAHHAAELKKMYCGICSQDSLTLVTISDYSAQGIQSKTGGSKALEVLYSPQKNRPNSVPFDLPGIDLKKDSYLILLNAGRVEKNAAAAVAAFNSVMEEPGFALKNPRLKFVLVGINNYSDLGVRGSTEDARIVTIPSLPAAELEYLLKNARGLIYPSFHEGFGYPPVEAMSLGVPSVVSNQSSIPEVCLTAAVFCDPFEIDSIAGAIKQLLSKPLDAEFLKSHAKKIGRRQDHDLQRLVQLICDDPPPMIRRKGWCPICEMDVHFSSKNEWLRDHFICEWCNSIPRERALMEILQQRFPNWRNLFIHESSPVERGASAKLASGCKNYIRTQFDPELGSGEIHSSKGYRSEDLERQTFSDEYFDLVITQDVMEHVFDATAAFREIHRTLKPGGVHIFTTPLINKHSPTSCRAKRMPNGNIQFLAPAEYHDNPMSIGGSLVTWHWGFDIVDIVAQANAGVASVINVLNQAMGIEGEYLEVIVQKK